MADTATHTPGPWRLVDADNEILAGDVRVAVAPGWPRDGANETEREANLRLIAAAPDLLALLQRLHGWDHLDGSADGPYWRREIAAVLAKAEGQRTE